MVCRQLVQDDARDHEVPQDADTTCESVFILLTFSEFLYRSYDPNKYDGRQHLGRQYHRQAPGTRHGLHYRAGGPPVRSELFTSLARRIDNCSLFHRPP